MTHHEPITNLFAHATAGEVPRLMGQREKIECPHCYRPVLIAVRTEYIDWQATAEEYRVRLSALINSHNSMMDEMELIHGVDNPAAVYYRNKWAMFILECQKHFGMDSRGTSAHLGGGE